MCLLLIIIVSCTAVFFLLRNHPDGDTEANRRQRSRYHNTVESTYAYKASSSASKSWSSRLAGMLGIGGTKNNKRTRERSRGLGGWTRTGSGDEWDSDSEVEGRRQMKEATREMAGGGTPFPYSRDNTPLDSPFQPPVATFDPHNTSQPRDSLESQTTFPRVYPKPSSSTDTSPSIRLIRTTSPERLPNSITIDTSDVNGREFSTQSGGSMRTLEGGTKFIESL